MNHVWRKSSRSGTDAGTSDCVEVARLARNIGVRDSERPRGAHLLLAASTWHAFARDVKNGQHDLP
ncbi:DUF397 domain-containing protein [Actinomadura fibrosa]|uniref:DUF397 domain-containing protein n=1 Tax=Actinomadura fibrosa TaxID=111802 RepID=A0ABW2Y4A3_9ACTN|nr:DUF397 domain-containing protein [Actinomadura fibrosa]